MLGICYIWTTFTLLENTNNYIKKNTMKKLLLSSAMVLVSTFMTFGQTGVNFTASDCASTSHTLFTELDAGKVVVICWVMPCGACISSASTDATTVQGYASSNPGRVKFYLVDDTGNSTCSTLTSWASTNSITTDAKFGNAGNTIKMTDYGSTGMPKTVVMGGTSHTVFYNVNGTVSASALQTAINNALASTTGIADPISNFSAINLFPNPAGNTTEISYSLQSSSDVKIEVFNLVGATVKSISAGIQSAGEQKIKIDCSDLNNGIYFVKMIAANTEKTITLSVAH